MTPEELALLCTLLEKYMNETHTFDERAVQIYGEIFVAGPKKLNPDNTPDGSVKFFNICITQKLHDNKAVPDGK